LETVGLCNAMFVFRPHAFEQFFQDLGQCTIAGQGHQPAGGQ